MRALDVLMEERAYDREASFSKSVGLAFQPQSYSDFNLHPEFDEAFERWTQKDKYRGLDFARIWGMVLNCKHALSRCDGSVAELGVYQGQSASLLKLYADQFARKLYLCDTFDGFSEKQFEENMGAGKKAAFKDVSLESVKALVGESSAVRWVVGMFPDSITAEMNDDRFAFVSIDCDIYEPIRQGLEFFWPRMHVGGIIFIHDYASGYWPGATRAVDEFCIGHGVSGCLLPDMAGTYMLVRSRT